MKPGLTRRRIKKLIGGRPEYSRLEVWMLVNTRHHQADFKVTREDHMDALIEQLGRFGAELLCSMCFALSTMARKTTTRSCEGAGKSQPDPDRT